MKAVVDKRMDFIKSELPKLAYLISNILIYVDRQPMHNVGCEYLLLCANTQRLSD